MIESAELVEFYTYVMFILILISDRTKILLFVNVKLFWHNFAVVTHTCVHVCGRSRSLHSLFFSLKILRYELKKKKLSNAFPFCKVLYKEASNMRISSYHDKISSQMYLSDFYISN